MQKTKKQCLLIFYEFHGQKWDIMVPLQELSLRALLIPNVCMCSVTQLGPTLCDLMGCCLSGTSVHGISQTRILGWDAIPFSNLILRASSEMHRNYTYLSRKKRHRWVEEQSHWASCVLLRTGKILKIILQVRTQKFRVVMSRLNLYWKLAFIVTS